MKRIKFMALCLMAVLSVNMTSAATKVDDTHYTTEFPQTTTISGGYLFAWENGNWDTKNAEGDFTTEPVSGVVDVEVKAWVTTSQLEPKYFAENNWGGAEEWSWKEMVPTIEENVYMLDTIVFGGAGVNINDKADDADALYFAANEIVVLNAGLDGIPVPYIPEPRKRDTILYVPARKSVVLEAPTLLAGDTIKLFFNATDSTMSAFIIGRPAPAEEDFGIIFSDGSTIKGQKNEEQTEFLEYKIEANLTANATFQLYNFANKYAWTEGNIDEASTSNIVINGDNVYEVTADGKYTIYLKMFGIENNEIYVAYETSSSIGFNEVRLNAKSTKYIRNGRLVIIREGKRYNALGY